MCRKIVNSADKLKMNFLRIIIFCTLLHQMVCQSCEDYADDKPVAELVRKSPIIVEASLNDFKLQKLTNVTAKVLKIYPTRNGGLTVGSVLSFGPVGKAKNCLRAKSGKSYILFLKKSEIDDFYWITYNPMKRSKSSSRSLRKLLCKNCLVEVSFKKSSKTYKKKVGDKLKIKCKSLGKPSADISWYHNGVLLTKANTPKEIRIKKKKKGGSGSLQIKKLQLKHNKNVIICSATNIASETSANFTSKILVTESLTCKSTCTDKYKDYCLNDGCCKMSTSSAPPTCICDKKWHGDRCQDRNYWEVHGVSNPNKYGYQKRLITILGLCIGLMFVVIFCLSVYCLFKKRRSKMHLKLLHSRPNSGEQTPTLLHRNSNSGLVEDLTTCKNSETNIESTVYLPLQQEEGYTNQLESSPTHFQQLVRNASVNGSKRKRLNGVAKSSLPPHKKLSSSASLPTEQHATLLHSSKDELSNNAAERTLSCSSTIVHFASNSPNMIEKNLTKACFKSTLKSVGDDIEVAMIEQSDLNEVVIPDMSLNLHNTSSSS